MLYRRGSSVFWEEGSVHIEETYLGDVQEFLGQDFPIGDDDTDIWLQFPDGIQEIRIIFYLFWLQEGDIMVFCVFSHWRHRELMATASRLVRICHYSYYIQQIRLCSQIGENIR